ncbi:transposase domain-containing protein [Phthorimaea operculella]|nr:transposase domain-containing protein [Phthorimaea operculella]
MSSKSNISIVQRAEIVALHNQGRNYSEISRELGVTIKTVKLWVRRHGDEGTLNTRPKSGRPSLLNTEQRDMIVTEYEENGFKPTKHFAGLFDTSVQTIRRALHKEGLHHRRPAVKPFLTDAHKRARLEFAQNYLNFDWSTAIFSDEKTFASSQRRKLSLWRRNNTRYDSNHIVANQDSGRITLNMWGWMSAHGPGELSAINNRANGANYAQVLDDVMLPTARTVYPANETPEIIFVQDNCPIHRSHVVNEWFQQHSEVKVIPWPSKSPDLNPIENLWGVTQLTSFGRVMVGTTLSLRLEVG